MMFQDLLRDLPAPREVLETAVIGLAVMTPAYDHPMFHRAQTATPPVSPCVQTASSSVLWTETVDTARSSILDVQEHMNYLRRVSTQGTPPLITTETARRARRAWWAVWEATGFALPVPAACTGPDGQMLYTWDRERHHFELEVIPGKPAELFYRDRATGDLWGEDYVVGTPLPPEAVQRLKLFI